MHDSYIHSLSIHKLLNGWLAELLTILDSFFNSYASTTSTPIGVEGGGEPQNCTLSVGAILPPHNTHNS